MDVFKRRQPTFNRKPKYRVRVSDWIFGGPGKYYATGRFLDELSSYRLKMTELSNCTHLAHTWLLPFRDDFRHLIDQGNGDTIAAIQLFLRHSDSELRHVGIWLLSRFATEKHLLRIDSYCFDRSATVRKHVARALRRLKAWNLLVEMPEAYANDAWRQCFAPELGPEASARRSFSERLRDFKRNVGDSHSGEVFTPSRMPYWSLYDPWEGKPPKTMWYIRRMLRRIRHLVRWGVS
jgi:hypothetical protein